MENHMGFSQHSTVFFFFSLWLRWSLQIQVTNQMIARMTIWEPAGRS